MAESEEEKTSVEDAPEGAEAEEGAASGEAEQAEGESKEGEADSTPGEDAPLDASKFEPEVRKTPSDWYNWRHEKKEEKAPVAEPSKETTEESGELTPAAQKYLEKVAADIFGKVSKPVFDTLAQQEAARELSQFLTDPSNSHFRKYTPVVEKYMAHPAYQGVPVKNIFRMLDYENAMVRGAEGRKEADIAAKKNRSGGTTVRKDDAEVDYRQLTPAQYEVMRKQVQEGKTIK